MIVKIRDYPDAGLKHTAKAVEDINAPDVQKMIADMLETLKNTEHCGGLASTQLHIDDPYRIFVYYDYENDDPSTQVARVAVNPEIVSAEGEVFEPEGCMSVYPEHIHASVPRPARTTMRAMDADGNTFEHTREGYLAKLYIHETDHLNGTIYIDHLKPLKRAMIEKKIKKAQKLLAKK